MKNEDNSQWGARIERGEVTGKHGTSGSYTYDVKSYDRPGVEVYGLATSDGGEYAAGSKVYFFTFEDGKGLILNGIA